MEVLAIQLPPRRNRHVLTLLSALWPGLGQLVSGSRRAGLVLALPPLALLALLIAALVSPDRLTRLALLLDPAVISAVLVVEVALIAWRLGAVADAFRRGDGALGGRASVLTAIGLLFVLVPSVYAAYLTDVARQAASSVFSEVEGQPWRPTRTPPPDPDFAYNPSPEPSAPDLGRFTVLLIGNDSAPQRGSEFLTDTMIVASLDPVSGSVSMVSFPRDTVDVPLSDGRIFHGKINSLVGYVRTHPKQFPDAPSGETVLAGALGQLYGVQVNGWVEVNLPGFVKVVDSLKGVDVTVHDPFCDPTYHDFGFPNGFAVKQGRYHFDGEEALAYARVRKADGETDFTRAARQEEIVVALRDRIVSGGFVTDPAGFIGSFGDLVKTSLEPSAVVPYVGAASTISRERIFREVVTYPLIHFLPGDPRGWAVGPNVKAIRALGAKAFPPAGTVPVGLDTVQPDDGKTITKAPSNCLRAPSPTPSPKPLGTPAPSPGTTSEPSAPPTPEPTPEPTLEPSAGP
jgi:LCP family protein required for cell wall assembly